MSQSKQIYFDLDCLTCHRDYPSYFFCNINNTRQACCHPDAAGTDYFCTPTSQGYVAATATS